MGRHFVDLPNSVLKNILSYLTYEEVSNLRLVCSHNVRKVADFVLNSFFLSIPGKLEKRAKDLSLLLRSCNHILVKSLLDKLCGYRIGLILLSEIRMLNILCGRYVAANLCTFAAGSILDGFVRLLHQTPVDDNSSCVLYCLQCERYMNYFEEVLEPYILQKNNICALSRYGTKIIDILDCYYYCNHHLVVSQDGPYWHCTGKYETVSAAQITKPPIIPNNSSDPEVFKSIVHYIRNNVRWNNILHFIEMSLQSVKEVAERSIHEDVAVRRNSEMIFKRRLGEVDLTKQGMIATLNILNTKQLMPICLQPYLTNVEGHHAVQEDWSKRERYRFEMELQLHHNEDNGRLMKTVIHICQENTSYTITQKSWLMNQEKRN